MRWKFVLLLFFIIPAGLFAQKQKADSLIKLLAIVKTDTVKVELMREISSIINMYDPVNALNYAQQALELATEIKFEEGKSKALGALANTFRKIGNYPKALEYNFRKLQLEEKGNNPNNLAFVLLNIGIVYRYQEEYQKALLYYYKSDSVIKKYNLEDLKYFIYMNLGDLYERLNNTDSAFNYFNKSLIVSTSLKNDDYIGNSMTGLGHTYLKMDNSEFSLLNYRSAIKHLQVANNDEVLCEAYLGLAGLYQKKLNKTDSAVHYARLSFKLAEKDGFMNWQLDATQFLTELYKKENNVDSAFLYLSKTQLLNDSINSKDKIRQIQLLSSNENIRQLELAENKKKVQRERKQQLQYLFIGIFIPGFFLFTLLLSRIQIHTRIIKILGVLSLLILFEYLLLLLHPKVAELTNHTPVYEMLIFVAIAAILIPGHHRFETWLIEKLIHKKGSIRLKKVKFKVKGPSN